MNMISVRLYAVIDGNCNGNTVFVIVINTILITIAIISEINSTIMKYSIISFDDNERTRGWSCVSNLLYCCMEDCRGEGVISEVNDYRYSSSFYHTGGTENPTVSVLYCVLIANRHTICGEKGTILYWWTRTITPVYYLIQLKLKIRLQSRYVLRQVMNYM